MVNIDTRLLDKADESELFLLVHLAKRMRDSSMTCFPSVDLLMSDTGWQKQKVLAVKKRCIEKGFIAEKKRCLSNTGKQTSNLYTIKTPYLSVFISLKGKGDTQKEGYENHTTKKIKGYENHTDRSSENHTLKEYENHTLSISNSFEVLPNEVLAKESKNAISKISKSKQAESTTVDASIPDESTKAIVPASCKSDTKTLYRMIENKEELAKVTEQVIIANVESFKMFYESKGFKEKNAFHYAVDFAQYFFTKFPLCSLSDEKIKDQLCTWYFIFNNTNEAIAKNKKVEDLGLTFAERQAKEAAAVQQAKPQATSNSHLSKFEQMVKEKNRLAFEESQK